MSDAEAKLAQCVRAARTDPARAVLEGFHPLKHALRFGAAIELAVAARAAPLAALAARLAPDIGPWLERHLTLVAPAQFERLTPRAGRRAGDRAAPAGCGRGPAGRTG